jgi:phage shock protein E
MIDEGATLVDVRTDFEYREGHLPGALNIPHDQITSRLNELPSDKARPVVLYCRSGRRSGIAQKALADRGFTNVINAGGYADLMRARPR